MNDCLIQTWPTALALIAAALFAVGIQLSKLGLAYTDSQTGVMIQIGAATAVYWLAAPFLVESSYFLQPIILLLLAIGLFRPAISGTLALEAIRRMGPTVSATLTGTQPLWGVAFGLLLLGEALTRDVLLGSLAVFAGITLLTLGGGEARRDWALWMLVFPFGAAVLRTLAQVFAKIGMAGIPELGWEGIPSPFFVGLVGYSVSLAVAGANFARRGRRAGAVFGRGFKWLVLAGLVYAGAVFCLNTALACGQLISVSPLVGTTPLFSMLLGLVLFGEKHINLKVIGAVALVVPGVALIAFSRAG